MFDRQRGLIWYRILQFLTILWALTSFCSICVGPVVNGVSTGELYDIFPLYVIAYRILSAINLTVLVPFIRSLKQYSFEMLRWCKALTITRIASQVIISFILYAEYAVAPTAADFGSVISIALVMIPSYIYLKRRWKFESVSSFQNADFADIYEAVRPPIEAALENPSPVFMEHPTKPDVRFCRFCGSPVENEDIFCRKCGKKVRE